MFKWLRKLFSTELKEEYKLKLSEQRILDKIFLIPTSSISWKKHLIGRENDTHYLHEWNYESSNPTQQITVKHDDETFPILGKSIIYKITIGSGKSSYTFRLIYDPEKPNYYDGFQAYMLDVEKTYNTTLSLFESTKNSRTIAQFLND